MFTTNVRLEQSTSTPSTGGINIGTLSFIDGGGASISLRRVPGVNLFKTKPNQMYHSITKVFV